MAIPVLLDCDPGHDDAMAILLAAAHPAIELLGITTVAGNQTLPETTLNARRVCTVAGITSVPIAAAERACRGGLRRRSFLGLDRGRRRRAGLARRSGNRRHPAISGITIIAGPLARAGQAKTRPGYRGGSGLRGRSGAR
jgi:hypothetical protein